MGVCMTKLFLVVGAVVLVGIIGGGVWLAVSPMTPTPHTVHTDLPDTFQR